MKGLKVFDVGDEYEGGHGGQSCGGDGLHELVEGFHILHAQHLKVIGGVEYINGFHVYLSAGL